MLALRLAERGQLPDWLVRVGVRHLLRARLVQSVPEDVDAQAEATRSFLRAMDASPIAVASPVANRQHYEVPSAFFALVMGRHLKYSCGWFAEPDHTLDEAEGAMLALTCQRAGIDDGSSSTAAQRLVERVADAYRADDLDVVMGLFDPDISIHWNGERVALGTEEARRYQAEELGVGTGDRNDLHVRKRLRSASGDTIAVEHESSHRDDDGTLVHAASAEFWTLRRGLILEWRVYQSHLD